MRSSNPHTGMSTAVNWAGRLPMGVQAWCVKPVLNVSKRRGGTPQDDVWTAVRCQARSNEGNICGILRQECPEQVGADG